MLMIDAEYETEPFRFLAFVGKLSGQEARWEGGGDPVQAFLDMKRDLIRDGICAGGQYEHLPVMWKSSMTHLVMDSDDLRYEEGELEVDGTVYRVEEILVRGEDSARDSNEAV